MKILQLDRKRLIGFRVLCEGDQYAHEIPKAAAGLKERLSEINGIMNPEQLIGAFVVGDCPDEEVG